MALTLMVAKETPMSKIKIKRSSDPKLSVRRIRLYYIFSEFHNGLQDPQKHPVRQFQRVLPSKPSLYRYVVVLSGRASQVWPYFHVC